MVSSHQPAEVLNKRLSVLKALLGSGWLGPAWTERPDGPSSGPRVQTWPDMERRYSNLARWLATGLGHLCRLCSSARAHRAAPLPPSVGAAEERPPGMATLKGPADFRDIPVAVLQGLYSRVTVSPNGISTSCRVSAGDLLQAIVPLLAWLYSLNDVRLAGAEKAPARCLVLLSAVPGAGKSVIAGIVEQFSRLLDGRFPSIQAVGMDGWHLPGRVMQARRITDESGRTVPLATRKGSLHSFDVKRLRHDLEDLVRSDSPVRLPVYDRNLHEPVPEAMLVASPIVLLEGNYLLLESHGWEGLTDLASGCLWIDAPAELAHLSIVERHEAAGRSRQKAEAKWVGNDWPNARIALRGRCNADAVLYEDTTRRIRFVHRLGRTPGEANLGENRG